MKKALTFALAFCCLAIGLTRSSFAQDASQPPVTVAAEGGNKEQDRLNGPVRRVRVETTKIMSKDGNWVEGPREVRGIATYDPTGKKIDAVAYPVEASTLPGKEQYLYDDKGNVVEMILRSNDGSMLSKESYKYEFDQLGNWTKMSSSVAVYEDGKISFEPTGITYRTISYYYNQAIEKLNAPSPKSNGVSAPSTSYYNQAVEKLNAPSPNSNGVSAPSTPSTLLTNSNASSTDSPRPSTPAAQVSTTTQPLSEAANAHAKKELVTAPASVAAVRSSTAAPDGPVATSSEAGTTTDNVSTNSAVQHVTADVLRNAAIELPKPEYSDAALLARANGKVRVQMLVDENGNVTNAQATSGHPLLGAAAEAEDRKARFSLIKASSGATRVYGVLSYDFVPPTPASEAIPPTSPTIDRNPPKPDDRNPEAGAIPERAGFVESKPKALANYSEAARSFYDKGVTFPQSSLSRYREPKTGLSADEAVAYALSHNGELAAFRKEIEAARGLVKQASLRPNLQLDFERKEQINGADNDTMVSAMLPLELGGRRSARVLVAQRELEMKEQSLADRERLLAAEVRAKFGEALGEILKVGFTEDLLSTTDQGYKLVAARVIEGRTAPLEQNMVLVELNRIRSMRESSEGKIEVALLELRNLIGMSLEQPLRLRGDLDHLIEPLHSVAVSTGEALRERPDLHAARALETLAEARIAQARSEGKIDASVTGKYELMNFGFPQRGFNSTGQLVPIQGSFHSIGVGITLDLPVRNRNQGAIEAAIAERAAATQRREFAEFTVRREVASAFARYQSAARAAEIYRVGVQGQANANLDVVRQTYELGSKTLLDFIAEQRRFIEVQSGYIEALVNTYQARVEIERATASPNLIKR